MKIYISFIKFLLILTLFIQNISTSFSKSNKYHSSKYPSVSTGSPFNYTPTQDEIKIGRLISNLFKELNGGRLSKSSPYVNELKNISLENTHFKAFESWRNKILAISKANDIHGLSEVCTPLIAIESNDTLNTYLENQFLNQCIYSFLTLPINTNDPKSKILSIASIYLKNNLRFILDKKFNKHLKAFLERTTSQKESFNHIAKIILNESKKLMIPLENNIIQILSKSIHAPEYLRLEEPLKITFDKNLFDEFKSQSKSLRRYLKKEGIDKKEIIKKTLEILSYYQANKDKLNKDEFFREIMLLGKVLTHNHFYNLSRKFFLIALDSGPSDHEYFEIVFYYLWTHLKQNEYTNAVSIIDQFQLLERFSKLPSQLQFWVAYTLEKTSGSQVAMGYYSKIISNHPLSFYSIMAAKKTLQFGENLNGGIRSTKEILIEQFQSKSPNLIIDSVNYSENYINTLYRINIWARIGEKNLISIETNSLLNLKRNEVFQSDKNITIADPNEIHIHTILNISKILSQTSNYLKCFFIIQKAIENNKIPVTREILHSLFPIPYLSQIKNQEKDIDPLIILSLIRQESAFNTNAKSTAGARGLMQLMLPTAKRFNKKITYSQLTNPQINISLGVKYLKSLLKRYDGNLVYTLSAYNAGEKNLERWVKNNFTTDSLLHNIESIPFTETRLYVKLIFRNIYFYKLLQDEHQDSYYFNRLYNVSLGPHY